MKLNLLMPDTVKSTDEQVQILNSNMNNIQNWGLSLNSSIVLDITTVVNVSNGFATYQSIIKRNFSITNQNCLINACLSVSGDGFIGISVNGTLKREIYFNSGTNIIPVSTDLFAGCQIGGGNSVDISFKANSGTVFIGNTLNLQIISIA